MKPQVTLTLTGDQHAHLQEFLFPDDGCEAVAFLLCSRREGDRRHRLIVQDVQGVPYSECPMRTPENVTWSTDYLADILDIAAEKKLSVIKVHSHPTGYKQFSSIDDASDGQLLPMIHGWVEHPVLHGSAVMLPDGAMFGRFTEAGSKDFRAFDCINVAGDELHFWYAEASSPASAYTASHAQAFDEGTIQKLSKLSIAVVGCSGTGSPLIEQLVRLGVGELVLVDDDVIEDRNINRILNSTTEDSANQVPKVQMLEDAIKRVGLGTKVVPLRKNLYDPDVVKQVAQCDVVFGCMDTQDGRYLLNTLASYYSIPYFDIGIRLIPKEKGGVKEVCGSIHYIRPGRSSLLSREAITWPGIKAAGLKRTDPEAFKQQVKDGYIKGVVGHRPAVITPNMFAASLGVNELLARIHPYRYEENSSYAKVEFTLAGMEIECEPEEGFCEVFSPKVGLGDVVPLLKMSELSERKS